MFNQIQVQTCKNIGTGAATDWKGSIILKTHIRTEKLQISSSTVISKYLIGHRIPGTLPKTLFGWSSASPQAALPALLITAWIQDHCIQKCDFKHLKWKEQNKHKQDSDMLPHLLVPSLFEGD